MEPEPDRRVERPSLTKLFAPQPGERPGDLEATLDRIARTARELFAADSCVATGVDSINGRLLDRTVVVDISGGPRPTATPFLEEEHAQQILAEDILFAEEAGSHVEYASRVPGVPGFASFAAAILCTPWRRRPLAILYLIFTDPHRISSGERELFEEFAENASQRFQIEWLVWSEREISKIGAEINQEIRQPEELLRVLRLHLGKLVDTSRCLLLSIYQPATRTFDVYGVIDGKDFVVKDYPRVGACSWVLENQRELLIEHLSEQSTQIPMDLVELSTDIDWQPESLLFVPLVLGGEPLGVLSVQHLEPRVYHLESLRILELIADRVALALNNLRLFEGMQRLNEVGQTLTRHLDSEAVLEKVVAMIREATGCDLALLFPYIEATDTFETTCIVGSLERPEHLQPTRPDDVAALALHKAEPTFAPNSRTLYESLGGDPKARKGHFEEREGIESTAALALRVSGEAVGVLFLNFRKPQSFLSPQRQLISNLADYAAIAIKNARVFGAAGERHVRHLEIVQAIDRELGRPAELGELLNTILHLANDQVQAEVASIFLYNPRRQELRIEAVVGEQRNSRLGTVVRLQDRGFALEAFKYKRPVLVDDVHAPETAHRFFDAGGSTASELDVPMVDGDEVVGILSFESPRRQAFREGDLEFLLTLANQAVLAVKKAQAYGAEKRLAEERGLLIELGKEFTGRLDRDSVLQLIVRRALEITRARTGILVLVDPRHGDLEIAAEIGNPRPEVGSRRRMNRDDGVIGVVINDLQLKNIADVTVSPWRDIYRAESPGTVSELAVPLLSGSEVRGVLNVESPFPDHFREHDERLLEALADFAVIALQNAERYEQAQRWQRRLTAMHEAGNKILHQIGQPDLVMCDLVRYACSLTDATDADLYLYEGGTLAAVYSFRASSEEVRKIDALSWSDQSPVEGIASHVAHTLKSYRTLGDAQADPNYRGEARIHSEMAVPFSSNQEVIIVLNVKSEASSAFDDSDQEVLELFAAQALVTIENMENFARAERERRRFEFLHQAGQQLGQITDLEQLDLAYDIGVRFAESQFDCRVVARRYDQSTHELILVRQARSTGLLRERISADHGLNGEVARTGQLNIVANARLLPPEIQRWQADEEDHSFVVAPIKLPDAYYGNLALSHHRENYFQQADVELIEGLCQQLAITIHRLETVKEVQEAHQRALENEAMSWIGRQAYEIAHRLGNELGLAPRSLRYIRGALEEAQITNTKVGEHLDMVENGTRAVLALSKTLANRLAEERFAGEKVAVSAHTLIQGAVDTLRLPQAEDSLRLSLEIAENLGEVSADPEQVTMALLNLMTNAVEAMPQGGHLTVGAMNDGSYVRIWVQDTGRGIEPQNLSRIFNLYYTTKTTGSAGWGLASVRRCVEENGGRVEVTSAPGKGSTFTILLPLFGTEAP